MRLEDLRRWVRTRRAAAERERDEASLTGASPESAIAGALALIALVGDLHGWPPPENEVRRGGNVSLTALCDIPSEHQARSLRCGVVFGARAVA